MIKLLLCATLLITISTTLVSANFNLAVTNDKRKIIELGSFGFSEGGVISISFKKLSIAGIADNSPISYPSNNNNATIGFVIDTVDTAQTARSERDFSKTVASCFLFDPETDPRQIDPKSGVRYTIYLNGTNPQDYAGTASTQAVPFSKTIQQRGLYSVFYFNCLPGNPAVSFNIRVEEYNVDAAGQRNYLSYGDRPLGSVYLVFCLFFGGLLVFWRRLMTSQARYVKRVHQIVSALLLIKCLSLFFETFKYFHYASTGERDMWDFFYYVFLTLKGVTLFAVIVLLGSGWSSARAFLSENDRKLLLFLLPTQVFINISIAILEETSEGNWWWGMLLNAFRFLDVVCLLAVLLPLVWSMKNLSEAASHEDKAVVNLERMKTFRTFYLVFVGYIYATRVLLVVVVAALPFGMMWFGAVVRELAAACLYGYIVYAFQPGPAANPYEMLDPEFQQQNNASNNSNKSTTSVVAIGSPDEEEMKKREELETSEEVS